MANEKRLIDANALKRFTCETCNAIYGDEPCEPCDCRCMAVIDEQPTVDAVEVVRCVNCRSLNMTGYDEDNAHITDPLLQSGFCEMWGKDTQLCNFCSYGERRTDG